MADIDTGLTTRADVLPAEYEECFGCGLRNPAGIALQEIQRIGTTVTARFLPQTHHQGFPGVLHGGVITAALDEAMSYACVLTTGRWSATAKTELRFRLPAPTDVWLQVEAGVDRSSGGRSSTWAKLFLPDGRVCAEATAIFIAVADEMFGGLVPPHLTAETLS